MCWVPQHLEFKGPEPRFCFSAFRLLVFGDLAGFLDFPMFECFGMFC